MVYIFASLQQPTFSVLRLNFAHLEFSQSLLIKHAFHYT